MNLKQKSIFNEQETRSKDQKWFIATNRMNLLTILASGLICPADCYEKYSPDLHQNSGNSIILLKDGLHKDLNEIITDGKKSHFPVLLEIETDKIVQKKVEGIDSSGEIFHTTIENPGKAYALKLSGAMPVTAVKRILFSSEDSRSDFRARGFSNVPTDLCPTNVDENLFSLDFPLAVQNVLNSLGPSDFEDVWRYHYRSTDSFAGALVLFMLSIPSEISWIEKAADIFEGSLERISEDNDMQNLGWLPYLNNILRYRKEMKSLNIEAGTRLFMHTILRMRDSNPSEGWRAISVLEGIYEDFMKDDVDNEQVEEVNKWCQVCRDILENRREVSSLADSETPEKRAILLMLLRPDPTDLLKSRYSSLKPGNNVMALGALLCGARVGFERLDNEFKYEKVNYPIMSELKAIHFNNLLKSQLKDIVDIPALKIEKTALENMSTRFAIKVGQRHLIKKTIEGDLYLRMVRDRAEKAGYRMEFEHEYNRLSYRFQFKGDRKQIIYISRGKDNRYGEATVRFWSLCLDLSKTTGKRRLTKNLYEKLMKMNCDAHLNCRFGQSDKEEAIIVLVDQIVETIDQKELKAHLEHVANVADNYERGVGRDQY